MTNERAIDGGIPCTGTNALDTRASGKATTNGLNHVNDVFVRHVFGSKDRLDMLASFLNAVLSPDSEEEVVTDIELIDRDLPLFKAPMKPAAVAARGRLGDGRVLDVEILAGNDENFDRASPLHMVWLYCDSVEENRSQNAS